MFKTYEAAKVYAQESADRLGMLYRVGRNGLTGEYYSRMVGQLRHQFGTDREGELVEPSDYDAMIRARGPGGELTSDPETAAQRARSMRAK
jgi:hypothetical protein